jgi:hypothetical protein
LNFPGGPQHAVGWVEFDLDSPRSRGSQFHPKSAEERLYYGLWNQLGESAPSPVGKVSLF